MAATAAAVHGIRHDGVQVLRSGGRVGRHLSLLAAEARAAAAWAGLTARDTSLPGAPSDADASRSPFSPLEKNQLNKLIMCLYIKQGNG